VSFLRRFNIIGRMRDAEAEAGCLAFRNMLLNATLRYGAEQHNYAVAALREISSAASSVGTPNGTTKKLGRLADDALEQLAIGVGTTEGEFTAGEQAVGA
jgi:hypothetical protein